MADWYSRRNGDFEEADVWSFAKQSEASSAATPKTHKKSAVSSSSTTRRVSAAIPVTGAGEIPATGKSATVQRSSAPMNIPDWSKIYGGNGGYYDDYQNNDAGDYSGGDDDDDDDVVPPHEWLAKKLARSQISSFSVCEGIGRTLKGRDLSKVRNAILTKTGFLE